jgi:hypothetical protein
VEHLPEDGLSGYIALQVRLEQRLDSASEPQ